MEAVVARREAKAIAIRKRNIEIVFWDYCGARAQDKPFIGECSSKENKSRWKNAKK